MFEVLPGVVVFHCHLIPPHVSIANDIKKPESSLIYHLFFKTGEDKPDEMLEDAYQIFSAFFKSKLQLSRHSSHIRIM